MHPINRLLAHLGVGVHRLRQPPAAFMQSYEANLRAAMAAKLPYRVLREVGCDIGNHPASYKEHECGFAADCLARQKPATILDIGSYRDFVLGLAAAHQVTTLDVRAAPKICANETVAVEDAKSLSFADDRFDAVVSLSSIEHFGLGRYGDEFDLTGDRKALREMIRVLKPGGAMIFSTTLTAGPPCLVYNLHRIYTREILRELCRPLTREREAYFSHRSASFCDFDQISKTPGVWDVYCGCWTKAAPVPHPSTV